jgi:hypothetical protein
MKEKEFYRDEIVKMVNEIKNSKFIKIVYGCVKACYSEEKAGE